jgi:hypothetical protein
MSVSSSPLTAADARAPQLAAANGSAGVPHALWRPQMQTFLMRVGMEERDYAVEIPEWSGLAAAVQESAVAKEQAAISRLLGRQAAAAAASSSQGASAKKEKEKEQEITAQEKEDKLCVAALIGRSRKAFGYLYSALSADLRPLVADVPQGYAFGIWSFLEKKFRSTEQDSVMALWERITSIRQDETETFDVYKARVDAERELLAHAKQALPPGLYASLLLWRLQPRYATAVLTLKTGDLLKDAAAIDWQRISEYMAQYERSQLGLGDIDGPGVSDQRAMSARSKSKSKSGDQGHEPSNVQCFNCHKYGHYASRCPMPDRRGGAPGERERSSQKSEREGKWLQQRNQKSEHRGEAASSSSSSGEERSGDEAENKPSRARGTRSRGGETVQALRQTSRYSFESDEEGEPSRARSYDPPGRARSYGVRRVQ